MRRKARSFKLHHGGFPCGDGLDTFPDAGAAVEYAVDFGGRINELAVGGCWEEIVFRFIDFASRFGFLHEMDSFLLGSGIGFAAGGL